MTEIPADAPYRVRLRRNKSWLNSLKLTGSRVIFYGPSSLSYFVAEPLIAVVTNLFAAIMALVAVVLGLVAWFGTFIIQIVAGLFGFVSPPDKPNSP